MAKKLTLIQVPKASARVVVSDLGTQLERHLLQSEGHSAADLPYELQCFYGCNAHTISGCFQRQPSPITRNAIYFHMTWPV